MKANVAQRVAVPICQKLDLPEYSFGVTGTFLSAGGHIECVGIEHIAPTTRDSLEQS